MIQRLKAYHFERELELSKFISFIINDSEHVHFNLDLVYEIRISFEDLQIIFYSMCWERKTHVMNFARDKTKEFEEAVKKIRLLDI